MLNIDEIPWAGLTGGYRSPYDPRRALQLLESSPLEAWAELWQELYHQGDAGVASYAAVPFLVQSYRQRTTPEWNTYAIVAAIELARDKPTSPRVPDWLLEAYEKSIAELAQIGLTELQRTEDPDLIRGILAVVALWKGARTYSRLLLEFSEAEVRELETRLLGSVVG